MRIIKDQDMLMTEMKNGTHDVVDMRCPDINESLCFRFGQKGEIWRCQRFGKLPTGVKICRDR